MFPQITFPISLAELYGFIKHCDICEQTVINYVGNTVWENFLWKISKYNLILSPYEAYLLYDILMDACSIAKVSSESAHTFIDEVFSHISKNDFDNVYVGFNENNSPIIIQH